MTIEHEQAERFKAEHRHLMTMLSRLQDFAMQAAKEVPDQALNILNGVRDEVLEFIGILSEHARWEEEEWYPRLRQYCLEYQVPHAIELLETAEEDHYLAKMFAGSFITKLDGIVPPAHNGEVQNAAAALNKTCQILREHFSREEELMDPVIDGAGIEKANF